MSYDINLCDPVTHDVLELDDQHDMRGGNYWDATEGNAKRALLQLVALAKLRPDGVWDGD